MTQIHPDNPRLVALIAAHDRESGNNPDAAGRVAGFDSLALLGAAGERAQQMIQGYGTLRKTLTPQQLEELRELLAAMWKDGFAVGARSQQQPTV